MNPMREFTDSFGSEMYCLGIPVYGVIDDETARRLATTICEEIGMTKVGEYTEQFAGMGVGFTYVLTLIESYICIDSWHPKRDGAYLWVNSCKQYETEIVMRVISEDGLTIGGPVEYKMTL